MSGVHLSISEPKLTAYLLNPDHPQGSSKARFFIRHGFDPAHPRALADALLIHGAAGWPGQMIPTPYGTKHRILGPMRCPDGSTPMILAVWQVEAGGTLANLVTAYPR